MRKCQLFSCILMACVGDLVGANDKVWSGHGEVDGVDVVVGGDVSQAGDLASVSLRLQLLNVFQSADRETKKSKSGTHMMQDPHRFAD